MIALNCEVIRTEARGNLGWFWARKEQRIKFDRTAARKCMFRDELICEMTFLSKVEGEWMDGQRQRGKGAVIEGMKAKRRGLPVKQKLIELVCLWPVALRKCSAFDSVFCFS